MSWIAAPPVMAQVPNVQALHGQSVAQGVGNSVGIVALAINPANPIPRASNGTPPLPAHVGGSRGDVGPEVL